MTLFIRLRDAVKDMLRKADMVLLALCLVAAAYGILLIASASGYLGRTAQLRNIIIQSSGTLLGIGIYFVFTNIDVEHFSEKWLLFLLFNLGFIALLKTPLGVDVRGNVAWLAIPHFPVNIQPAEIVKLTYTVLLARQLAWFRDNRRMRGLWSLVLPAVHAGFMFVWIYAISKDAGSALVYLFIYAGMALAAGLPWYWFAAGGGAVCALGVAAIAMLDKLPPYWVSRFRVIFDHSYDIQGAGYQQRYSMLAIGSGGLFGQGLFQGIQTHAAVGLPDRQNDFIFAVCGEELGLVGCLAVIALEFFIVYRCFQTARLARSSMDALICVGFASMLIFQTLENIGMCLFIMPVIGLTLPFFSYGGSSIVTLFAAMGIVSGVRSRTLPDWLRKT